MPSLKEVQNKIVGVKKTQQITKAMNMVASAKLRGAQEKMESFRPYTSKFNDAMSNLSGGSNTDSFPLMENREIKTVEIVVITSDRGLCGSFNSNIIKLANKKTRQYESEGKKVSFVCVGKKGNQILRKTGKVRKVYDDIMGSFQMFNAREIATEVSENFLNGGADKVEVLFGEFRSIAVQAPAQKDFLPVQPLEPAEGEEVHAFPDGAVRGHVAAGLAHQPDRGSLDGFTSAGSEEEVVHGFFRGTGSRPGS